MQSTPAPETTARPEENEEIWPDIAVNTESPSSATDSLLRSSIRLALFGSLTLMVGTPLLINGTLQSSVGLYLPLSLLFYALMKLQSRGYNRLAGWSLCTILFSAVVMGVLFFGGIKAQQSSSRRSSSWPR